MEHYQMMKVVLISQDLKYGYISLQKLTILVMEYISVQDIPVKVLTGK